MKYTVTVLTPLLVGDGQRLSPIDYMVWKDQVNILDQRRIFRLLAKGPRLEPYLAQLRRSDKLDFASWGGFAQNFAGRRIPFEHASSTAVWQESPAELLHIPTFAAGTAGPYLPGSALKGAIRTAYAATRLGEGMVKELAGRMEGERGVRRLGPAAEAMAFGSPSQDPLRLVSAGDSQVAPLESFKIYVVRVASLVSKPGNSWETGWKQARGGTAPRVEQGTATFVEMAVPGTRFTGGWSENAFLKQPDVARQLHIRGKAGSGEFVAAANDHAAQLLSIQRRYAEFAKLRNVSESLSALESQLQSAREAGACLMNLGWGGGLLSKSAVLDTSDEAYRSIVRMLPFYERAIRTGMPFPKTRKIVFVGGQPATLPGWVRLEVS